MMNRSTAARRMTVPVFGQCQTFPWVRTAVVVLVFWLLPAVAIGLEESDVPEGSNATLPGDNFQPISWFSCVSLLSHPYRRKRAASERNDDINSAFVEHYRCPEELATFSLDGPLSDDRGYFRFGPDTICYGNTSPGLASETAGEAFYDALSDVTADRSGLKLPFNPTEVATNLRYERYVLGNRSTGPDASMLRKAYYLARPFLGVPVRKHLQRIRLRGWKDIQFPKWPVDATVESLFERLLGLLLSGHKGERIPFVWFWPDGFQSCVMMTHDVETSHGRDYCSRLMDLDAGHGVKSAFQIVPEGRYQVSTAFLDGIRDRGFEINVHDLNHDGYLFSDRQVFLQRSEQIKRYAHEYGASGFRSAILYRNPDWLEALDFEYDMSVPTSGHLEAQQGGCCSVMPFFIGSTLELPLTTTQDYSLFHILNDYSIDVWKRQVDAIREKHGLASFIIHPDYVMEARSRNTYNRLLAYLGQLESEGDSWFALPAEINRWWRDRSEMTLTRHGNSWEIEGAGKERAQIAYATLEGDRIVYVT
jgi:hypothetical protein